MHHLLETESPSLHTKGLILLLLLLLPFHFRAFPHRLPSFNLVMQDMVDAANGALTHYDANGDGVRVNNVYPIQCLMRMCVL